ncbi:MAG: TIGR04283 family arsenosugar biosynthesis glycosyltransferase [Candidatus Binatia bacterium]
MSAARPARVSIIVPARNEERVIAATLAPLREPDVLEVIVADGESEDATAKVAAPLADRVLRSPPGRARQMNAAARIAIGDILFFLHADSRVPAGFARAIVDACGEGAIGGRFDLELDAPGIGYRIVENGINLRSRWSGLFTGDQGLFIRRQAFSRLGGFPDQPLFEDLALAAAMKQAGRVASLRLRIRTSARRWRRSGIVRTVLFMWWLRALYFLGVSPDRLATLYREVR